MPAELLLIFGPGAASAVFAVVLFGVWRWIEPSRHVLLWSLGHGLLFAGALLLYPVLAQAAGRAELWLCANAAALASASFVYAGFRVRAGRAPQAPALLGAALLVLAATLWFAAVQPLPAFADAIVPIFCALLLLACVPTVATTSVFRSSERSVIGALLLFGSLQLVTGASALFGDADASAPLVAFRAIAHPTIAAGSGALMMFLVARDLSDRMKSLATVDALTGALNRRGFQESAHRALGAARRSREPLTLIMADLDHFRRINDSYGHAAGDAALRRFASHLESELRQSDLVGRIGGEEFALLLSDTELTDALRVAERLRHAMELAAIEVGPARIALTASFGVAELSFGDADVEDLLERADRGLYLAKETGRNRVCVAPDGEASRDSDFAVA